MPKKSKKEDTSDSSSDSGPEDREPVKKKAKSDGSLRTDAKEPTWDLGNKKFVKISEFKGKVYVNIREFYNADGDLKPGKKGIMLTGEQWQCFKASVDEVDEEFKKAC